MDPIKEIIPQVIANLSQKKPDTQLKIQRAWESIIGPKLTGHTMIAGFKEDILYVHVDSSACLYQLNMKKRKILEEIREHMDNIKDINLKIGKVK